MKTRRGCKINEGNEFSAMSYEQLKQIGG